MRSKIITVLLLALLLFTLTACDTGGPTICPTAPPITENNAFEGRYLPTEITADLDGETVTVDVSWSEDGCSFTFNGSVFTFSYDKETRALDVSFGKEGSMQVFDDYCTFDASGRILSTRFGDETDKPIIYSYDGDSVTLVSAPEETELPDTITIDMQNRSLTLFGRSFSFTRYGDVLNYSSSELLDLTYDQAGNLTAISTPQDAGENRATISIEYGTSPMTHTWQLIPMKMFKTYYLGYPLIFNAVDVFCAGLTV